MNRQISAKKIPSLLNGARTVYGKFPKIMPVSFWVATFTASLLVLVCGGAAAQVAVRWENQLPANAAFRIGDSTTTVSQLQQRIHVLEVLYGVKRPSGQDKVDQFNRATAKAVAVSDLLSNVAKQQGIIISDKMANDQIDKIISQNYNNDRGAYSNYLKENRISGSSVPDEIKRQMASAQLFAKVTSNAQKSSDGDAQDYYNKNKNQMVSPEQRDIRNIVCANQQQATEVGQQATSGVDFGSLVGQYSMDQSTKSKGGELGMVSADELDPGYAKAAFEAPAGSVFGPVKTQQGWNIGQVTNVQNAVPLSFDQLKSDIKTKLDNDAKYRKWNDWFKGELRSADIQYAPNYLPADPTAPPQNASK